MTRPSILMVHGFASSSAQSWARFGWIEAFEAQGARVLAPDLPGHGSSEKPKDPQAYGAIEDMVYDDTVGLRPVDAIGFSLGARLVLSVEAEHPGTFERLVVGGIGANIFNFRSPEHLAGAIEARDHQRAPESSMAEAFVRGAYGPSNDAEALVAFLRRPRRRRILAEDLERVRCPVLVVVGEADVMVHPVSLWTDHLSHVSLVRVPEADHLATMRSPLFLASALEFLTSA
jgi:pimeloyl-ACP methyl ester carboxylesterase